jgi:NADP-reducing hydrogenase subunit HndC
VFALAGKINHTGLVEVPFGISVREVMDLAGGIPGGHQFKALQTGGPSGGCVPASMFDLPIDYESLASVGTIVGSGGLLVMDETSCMVDVARFYMDFCMHESCGKCIPCRTGTAEAVRILDRMTRGLGTRDDLERLEELCPYMQDASLCGLGQTAPNPVVSTLHYFRDEYLAHIDDRICPAGVCRMTGSAPFARLEARA